MSIKCHLAYALVLLLTLFAFFLDNVTIANSNYRTETILAVVTSVGALLVSALLWRHLPIPGRLRLALCCLINLWTLFDAGFLRLPAVMGW